MDNRRYIAKVWFNPVADKFFGICDHTHDVHTHTQRQSLCDEIQTHFSQKITWEFYTDTNTTKGWIIP